MTLSELENTIKQLKDAGLLRAADEIVSIPGHILAVEIPPSKQSEQTSGICFDLEEGSPSIVYYQRRFMNDNEYLAVGRKKK